MKNKTDGIILPTNDLFIASPPKNEPILRSLLNSVLTNAGEPPSDCSEPRQHIRIFRRQSLDVLVKDETDAMYGSDNVSRQFRQLDSALLVGGVQFAVARPAYCI